ncbi:MAG: hypothetical protein Q9M11_06075 [Mariprofundaceae bacterium]|nr:hypothetical protein [Mariprofundaceae bacterium]
MKINSFSAIKYIVLFSGMFDFLNMVLKVPNGLSVLKIIITLMLLLSGVLLIVFSTKLHWRINYQIDSYLYVLYVLLLIWSVLVIIRSFSTEMQDMLTLLGNRQMGWVWLTPLAFAFGMRIEYLFVLSSFWISMLRVFLIIFLMIFISMPYHSVFSMQTIFLPTVFLIMIVNYLNFEGKIIIFFSVLALLIISNIGSDVGGDVRINYVFIAMALAVMYLLNVFYEKTPPFRKASIMMGTLFIMMILSVSMFHTSNDKKIEVQDTRTFLYEEMFDDLSIGDTIVGRGALGKYYSPFFAHWNEMGYALGDSDMRPTVEVGYLKMILKGGWLLLFLSVIILLTGAIKGMFYSRNNLSRACGSYIFMYLILWFLSLPPAYSPNLLLVWIAAGVCLTHRIGQMSEVELKKVIAENNIKYFKVL